MLKHLDDKKTFQKKKQDSSSSQLTPKLVDILAVQNINKDENPEDNVEVGDVNCPLQQPHLLLGSSKPIFGFSLEPVRHRSY
jgi:hypothetical protein